MCAVYIVAFMEKATLNSSNAFNIRRDLAIEGYHSSWIFSSAIDDRSLPIQLGHSEVPAWQDYDGSNRRSLLS
jgi:hypothetical protein